MAAPAIILRLTHTSLISARLYLTDIYDATDGPISGLLKAGPVYIGPGETIDLTFTASVALSYEKGVIKKYTDQGHLIASFFVGQELQDAITGGGWLADQCFFVHKHGNDTKDGRSWADSKLTFTAAISAASALTPAADNRFAIVCIDAGAYEEDISIPSWVDVFAPNAELVGSIILQDNSKAKFARQAVADDIAILKFAGTGTAEASVDLMELTGSGGIGVQNVSSGTLLFRGGVIEVDTGYAVGDGSSSQGHIHLDITEIRMTSGAAGPKIGISRVGAGQTIGRIGHIYEVGGAVGATTGIRVFSGEANLEVNVIDCNVAYNVSAGAIFRLITKSITGTETNNGTADIARPGALQNRDVLDANPNNGDVLTWNNAQNRWEPQVPPGAAGEAFTLQVSRNAVATNIYLRGPDGTPTNQSGFVLPFNATIFGIGAATTGNETWTAEVRKNDAAAVIASLSLVNVNKGYNAVSVDVNAGDEIQMYCNGLAISYPTMVVYLRRR